MIGYNTPFSTAAKHAVLIIGALIVILPFYIMATYSLYLSFFNIFIHLLSILGMASGDD